MFELPKLNYSYDSLEPYIDTKTMEVHYSKHHKAYTDNLNKALENYPELQNLPIEKLLTDLTSLPKDIVEAVKNNGGGYYNHSLFWQMLAPKNGHSLEKPNEYVADMLNATFGSFDAFKELFTKTATSRFGSGWAWLVKNADDKLEIYSTPNQETPISQGKTPLLTLDVWEHAYYLKYQNRRAEYIENWWNVVNWDFAQKQLLA